MLSATYWVPLLLFFSTTLALPIPEENESEESRKVLGSSVVTSVSVIMGNENGTKKAYFTDAAGRPVTKPTSGEDLGSPVDLISPDRYTFYTFDREGDLVKRYMTKDEVKSIIANGQKNTEMEHEVPTFYHGSSMNQDALTIETSDETATDNFAQNQMKMHSVLKSVQNVLRSQIESAVEHQPLNSPAMADSASWSAILPSYLDNNAPVDDELVQTFVSNQEIPIVAKPIVTPFETASSDSSLTSVATKDTSSESGSGLGEESSSQMADTESTVHKTSETSVQSNAQKEEESLNDSSTEAPDSDEDTEQETVASTIVSQSTDERVDQSVAQPSEDSLLSSTEKSDETSSEKTNTSQSSESSLNTFNDKETIVSSSTSNSIESTNTSDSIMADEPESSLSENADVSSISDSSGANEKVTVYETVESTKDSKTTNEESTEEAPVSFHSEENHSDYNKINTSSSSKENTSVNDSEKVSDMSLSLSEENTSTAHVNSTKKEADSSVATDLASVSQSTSTSTNDDETTENMNITSNATEETTSTEVNSFTKSSFSSLGTNATDSDLQKTSVSPVTATTLNDLKVAQDLSDSITKVLEEVTREVIAKEQVNVNADDEELTSKIASTPAELDISQTSTTNSFPTSEKSTESSEEVEESQENRISEVSVSPTVSTTQSSQNSLATLSSTEVVGSTEDGSEESATTKTQSEVMPFGVNSIGVEDFFAIKDKGKHNLGDKDSVSGGTKLERVELLIPSENNKSTGDMLKITSTLPSDSNVTRSSENMPDRTEEEPALAKTDIDESTTQIAETTTPEVVTTEKMSSTESEESKSTENENSTQENPATEHEEATQESTEANSSDVSKLPSSSDEGSIDISNEGGNENNATARIKPTQSGANETSTTNVQEGSGGDESNESNFEGSGSSEDGSGSTSLPDARDTSEGSGSIDTSSSDETITTGRTDTDATKSSEGNDESTVNMSDIIYDVEKYGSSNVDIGVTTSGPNRESSAESSTKREDNSEQGDQVLSSGNYYDVNQYANSDVDVGVTTPFMNGEPELDATTQPDEENSSSGLMHDVNQYVNSDKDVGVTTPLHEEEPTTDASVDSSNTSSGDIYDVNHYVNSVNDFGITTPTSSEESKTETNVSKTEDDSKSSSEGNVNSIASGSTEETLSETNVSNTENDLKSSSEGNVNSISSESTEETLSETTTVFDIDQEMNDEQLSIISSSESTELNKTAVPETVSKPEKLEDTDDEKKDKINFYKTPLVNLKDKTKYQSADSAVDVNKKPVGTNWQKVNIISPEKNTQETSEDAALSLENIPASDYDTDGSELADIHNPYKSVPSLVKLHPAPEESLGLEASTAHLFEDVQKFADLCNELAFKMWLSVTSKGVSAARSLAMSPFAATSMLSMIFLGAKGPTSGQMNDILRLDDMLTFNPHQVFRNVTESVILEANAGVSTAAFVRELYSDKNKGKMLDFYKQRAAQFYDGHVEETNFATIGDTLRRRTNLLVKKQTSGKISEYMRGSNLELQSPLAAFSANIFQTDCSAASTEGRDGEMYFTTLPATRQRRLIPVPAVVYRSGFMAGYEPSLDATVVSIGQPDSSISTLFVVPGQQSQIAPGDGLPRLEARLLNASYVDGAWSKLLRSLLPRTGLEIQIPRFSHRSQLNLTHCLQTMGLNDLFDPLNADLKGLSGSSNDLHVSDIIQVNTFSTCSEDGIGARHHVEIYPAGSPTPNRAGRDEDDMDSAPFGFRPRQARLDVNQGPSGFEDLVQESIYQMPLALRPRQARIPEGEASQPRLKFDRPFLYFVRHNPTGFILHMGRFNPRLIR